MTGRQRFLFCGVLLSSAGCSPDPVVVSTPDSGTLESLAGRQLTLEGQVELHKEGLVLSNSGPPIVLEYYGAADASWPKVGTHVQVTGTLRLRRGPREEYPFRLDRPP